MAVQTKIPEIRRLWGCQLPIGGVPLLKIPVRTGISRETGSQLTAPSANSSLCQRLSDPVRSLFALPFCRKLVELGLDLGQILIAQRVGLILLNRLERQRTAHRLEHVVGVN